MTEQRFARWVLVFILAFLVVIPFAVKFYEPKQITQPEVVCWQDGFPMNLAHGQILEAKEYKGCDTIYVEGSCFYCQYLFN